MWSSLYFATDATIEWSNKDELGRIYTYVEKKMVEQVVTLGLEF
jgi:hypothetical protein